MFKRRKPLSFLSRIRQNLWPKSGWVRAFRYSWQRMLRIDGSAHAVALGLAAGAFASMTPFLGFHILIGGILAWVMGGNVIASAIGTWVGNPITFPFIWLSTFEFGHMILGSEAKMAALERMSFSAIREHPAELWSPVIFPMAVGSLPIGIAVAICVYYPSRGAINLYQRKRATRINRKRDNEPSIGEME